MVVLWEVDQSLDGSTRSESVLYGWSHWVQWVCG